MKRSLRRALELHHSAAENLLGVAESIPSSLWCRPVAEGKWTPAEIIEHLNCSYDIVLDELAGGSGMQIRTSKVQRLFLRLAVFPRILITGRFPEGARAPKETRPVAPEPVEQSLAIRGFEQRARRFDQAARASRPSQRLTHAYFGSASVANGIRLCARHIEHHCAQLPQTRD